MHLHKTIDRLVLHVDLSSLFFEQLELERRVRQPLGKLIRQDAEYLTRRLLRDSRLVNDVHTHSQVQVQQRQRML